MRARGEALTARDAAASERDDALQARQEALRLRDAALAARDEALAERRAAIDERDEISDRLASALSAQEGAARGSRPSGGRAGRAARANATTRCATATGVASASQRVIAERDALQTTIEQLRMERDDAVASRGAALVMRNAANAPPAYRRDGQSAAALPAGAGRRGRRGRRGAAAARDLALAVRDLGPGLGLGNLALRDHLRSRAARRCPRRRRRCRRRARPARGRRAARSSAAGCSAPLRPASAISRSAAREGIRRPRLICAGGSPASSAMATSCAVRTRCAIQ